MANDPLNQPAFGDHLNDPNEIERIQQEIERDLMLLWTPQPVSPSASLESKAGAETETGMPLDASVDPALFLYSDTYEVMDGHEAFDLFESVIDKGKPDAPETREATETPEVFASAETLSSENEPFYQETIKYKHTRGLPSLRRAVVLICLICTLGTGAVGLGLGLAIPAVQYYASGGINSQNSGENADVHVGAEASSFTPVDYESATPRAGALSDVVKLVEPSVVTVSATYSQVEEELFDLEGYGDGSGIIFSEDGQKVYIATNYSVVAGATSVDVYITDSEPLPARLVGRDNGTDLAVLSVNKKDLVNAGVTGITIAVFGDSDDMEVGDAVLAIGNALGDGNSATYGIISAKERTFTVQNRKLTVLQTDAAINPGNCGGPLVNARGEVIGINTVQVFDSEYWVEGMGCSIASNLAKPILEGLMNTTATPFLGVVGEDVTADMAEMYGIPPMGVLVVNVMSQTGAEAAGIVRTDIITSFNGKAIYSMTQLADEVKKCAVGDVVTVKILRDGEQPMTLSVKLGEYPLDNF